METKHTSAPWYPVEFAGVYILLDSDDYTGKNLFDSDEVGEVKAKANAKLAAAAPKMLKALKSLVNSTSKDHAIMYGFDDQRNEAIKIIKKATK